MNKLDTKRYNEKLIKWDKYFYDMCKEVAKNSSCLSRKIGSVLVNDNSIIGTGYNGPPRGIIPCDQRWLIDEDMRIKAGFQTPGTNMEDTKLQELYETKLKGKCPRYIPEFGFKSGQGLEWCVAGHSERNSLINSARHGIKTKDCKVYMDCGIPCTPCLVELINAGIEEIIVTKFEVYDISANYLVQQTDMKVRLYTHFCVHENYTTDPISGTSRCRDCGLYL